MLSKFSRMLSGFNKALEESGASGLYYLSGVEWIIRGKLEEMNLNKAKWLFKVKFWGKAMLIAACFLGLDFLLPFHSDFSALFLPFIPLSVVEKAVSAEHFLELRVSRMLCRFFFKSVGR
jgi:hypothetical protein